MRGGVGIFQFDAPRDDFLEMSHAKRLSISPTVTSSYGGFLEDDPRGRTETGLAKIG